MEGSGNPRKRYGLGRLREARTTAVDGEEAEEDEKDRQKGLYRKRIGEFKTPVGVISTDGEQEAKKRSGGSQSEANQGA